MMNVKTITLIGTPPSKKNSHMIIHAKGRPMIIPSKKYRDWEKEAAEAIKSQINEQVEACFINIQFIHKAKRKFDLTNKAESIMDALVKAKAITDDNYEVVRLLSLESEYRKQDEDQTIITITKTSGDYYA